MLLERSLFAAAFLVIIAATLATCSEADAAMRVLP